MKRLQELRDAGTAILLVTHNSQAIVQHCNRALLLVKGRMRLLDDPKTVIRVYERLGYEPEPRWENLLERMDQLLADPEHESLVASHFDAGLQATPPSCMRYEARGGEIIAVEILDPSGRPVNVLSFGMAFTLRLHYRVDRSLRLPTIGSNISNSQGVTLAGRTVSAWDRLQWLPSELEPGLWTASFNYQGGLLPGMYFVGASMASGRPPIGVHKIRDACMFRVSAISELKSFGYFDLASERITLSRSEAALLPGPDQS